MKRKCNAIQLKYCYDCGTVTTMSLPICSWIETSTHKKEPINLSRAVGEVSISL